MGELAWISAGLIILPKVRVGDRATTGVGAKVLRGVGADTTVMGPHAREIERESVGRSVHTARFSSSNTELDSVKRGFLVQLLPSDPPLLSGSRVRSDGFLALPQRPAAEAPCPSP